METIEPGTYEIDDDAFRSIISDKPGKTLEESVAKFESHDKHIDIQLCINGKEKIGWKPRQTCSQLKGEYDEKKMFYSTMMLLIFILN